jgi:hypothetical protein
MTMKTFPAEIKVIFMAAILILTLVQASPALSDNGGVAQMGQTSFTLKRGSEIDGGSLEMEENSPKVIPDFDSRHNKILSILRWNGATGPVTLVAVLEGEGRASSCSLYERVGDNGFGAVNAGAFCRFLPPTGEFNRSSRSVKYRGKIRQGYDSYETDIAFELFFDRNRGIFCDPISQSEKFKCRSEVGH